VKVSIEDCKQALELLAKSRSMFVRQPLVAGANVLSDAEYHKVAEMVFTQDPAARKLKHPTKTAFVKKLSEFVAEHEKSVPEAKH
jgi:hypothetical protein